jgi:acyl carrier protein
MQVESDLSRGTRPSRDRVLEDVKQIVGEQMGIAPANIQESDDLFNDLGCDSLDVVEIMMETEEHFAITVPDDVGQEIRTVAQIVDGVLQLLGHR